MKLFKRAGAAFLALCMVLCMFPMMPAKAAYVNIYSSYNSDRPTLTAGKYVPMTKYSDIDVSSDSETHNINYTWSWDYYSRTPYGLNVDISWENYDGTRATLYVGTNTDVEQGSYTLRIRATDSSNNSAYGETTVNISVGRNATVTYLSDVYIESPSELVVGDSFSKVRDSIKVYEGDHYTMKSKEIYTYNSNASAVSGESSVKGDRIYRIVAVLDAADGYKFDHTNEKSTSWTSGYSFYGAIRTSAYIYGTAVFDDGDTLYVGLEYRVSSDGTVTNPTGTSSVSSGGKINNVNISVTNGIARIGEISEVVAKNASNASNASDIVVDISGQANSVESARFSYGSFVNVANAVNTTNSRATGFEIRYPKASARLDGSALYTVANAAYKDAKDITITVSPISTSSLSTAQKEGITGYNVIQAIRAKTTVGSTEVTSFNGGTETISFKYTLGANQDGRYIKVYSIDSNGKLTAETASYSNGYVTFKTGHNSEFVAVYDASSANIAQNTVATTPVYRAYNANNGDHLFTVNSVEYNTAVKAGWKAEGIAFNVRTSGTQPVYRMYFKKSGEHLYTLSPTEKTNLEKAGWIYEGVSFYSGGTNAVFRLSNPNQRTNNHLFTTSATEKSSLVSKGWKNEDVAFYVN